MFNEIGEFYIDAGEENKNEKTKIMKYFSAAPPDCGIGWESIQHKNPNAMLFGINLKRCCSVLLRKHDLILVGSKRRH